MRHDNTHPNDRIHKPRFVSIQDTYTYRPQPEEQKRDWQWLWAVLLLVVIVGSVFIGG